MKTIQIGTFEAKNRLSELLTEVGRGRRVVITRRGKSVAVLSAPTEGSGGSSTPDSATVLAAFRELRKASSTGKQSIKELIEEGRR